MRAGRTRPRAASRRCLALVFPWLPSERLRSTRPHLFVGREETPVVFVTGKGQAARLVAVDRLATQEGLAPGLTLADARARVAAAESYEQDDHADHAWLEGLSEACGRYAASIALSPPDALILDVDSDVHGFRDDRSLADDVEERFARRGVVVRHAFGDTPAIAEALARFSGGAAPDERGAVRRLPLAALGLDEEDAAALREAGLRHVGEVMAQPHAMLATRFGKAVATAVRRLAANEEPSLATPRRNAPLAVERRFPEPIARGDAALEAIGALVLEAGAVLAARGQKGRRWHMRLYRFDGEVRSLQVDTVAPAGDITVPVRLLRERFAALDPVDATCGYDLIRVEVPLAQGMEAGQLKLEGGAARADHHGSPAPRPAQARGRRAACSLLPAQSELMLPASPRVPTEARPMANGDQAPPRPIHVFDPPQPIDGVTVEEPDAPPRRFRWRRTLHEVARVEGPERISGERWLCADAAGDGGTARDYFRIEDRRGRRLWIFRHSPSDTGQPARWYVHGVFA